MNHSFSRDRITCGSRLFVVGAIALCLLLEIDSPSASISLAPATLHSADISAMDAALGISGATIESFEDANLVAGLSIEHSNPDSGPNTVLPNLYFDGSGSFFNNAWDGPGALLSTFDNIVWFPPESGLGKLSARITFHFSSPVAEFGVGLGNFQAANVDHALLIDGIEVLQTIESLPNFTDGVNVRNGYLKLVAAPGESFSSVAFEVRANGSSTPVSGINGDGLVFDRLSFTPVPEPVSTSFLALGSLVCLAVLRKTKARSETAR